MAKASQENVLDYLTNEADLPAAEAAALIEKYPQVLAAGIESGSFEYYVGDQLMAADERSRAVAKAASQPRYGMKIGTPNFMGIFEVASFSATGEVQTGRMICCIGSREASLTPQELADAQLIVNALNEHVALNEHASD